MCEYNRTIGELDNLKHHTTQPPTTATQPPASHEGGGELFLGYVLPFFAGRQGGYVFNTSMLPRWRGRGFALL